MAFILASTITETSGVQGVTIRLGTHNGALYPNKAAALDPVPSRTTGQLWPLALDIISSSGVPGPTRIYDIHRFLLLGA